MTTCFANDAGVLTQARRFRVDLTSPDWAPRWAIRPGEHALAVIQDRSRRLGPMRWGWRRGTVPVRTLACLRAEDAGRGALAATLARQRCLVPATAWYEWAEAGAMRQPHAVRPCGREAVGIAALWETERAADSTCGVFALLTVPANAALRRLAPRMPAVIPHDLEDEWLSPATAVERLRRLLAPFDFTLLECYPVDLRVGRPGVDEPGLLRPVGE